MNKEDNNTLRVAFPSKNKSTSYEPTNINLDFEYIFLENIYSPLIEISKDGKLEPGVAEKIEWIGNDLKLTIRKNLKTKSDIPITTKDVVFSLKRLLVLSHNTHGNFNDIICPGVELKTVNDFCPGIKHDKDAVYLTAKNRKSFLLPMLAAIDFAIIPESSVDPKTLAIKDFSETSGPYYVETDDRKGNITLGLNFNHYFAAPDIPKKIIITPTDPTNKQDSLNLLKSGAVDHITIVDVARSDTIFDFLKSNPDYETHITSKIRSFVLAFTERGKKEFSLCERKYIGEKFKLAFSQIFSISQGFEQRVEFFPSLSEGGLTESQRNELKQNIGNALCQPKNKIKVALLKRPPIDGWSNFINKELPLADCFLDTNAPDFKKYKSIQDTPHAFVAATDTGFIEDIGLISYSLNAGFLGLDKSQRTQWLSDYMATEEKEERLKKLKALHFDSLVNSLTIPLAASPFTALVRKPWKMELSEFYANNQLWRIKLR